MTSTSKKVRRFVSKDERVQRSSLGQEPGQSADSIQFTPESVFSISRSARGRNTEPVGERTLQAGPADGATDLRESWMAFSLAPKNPAT
jgi:hypothetical protein